MSPIPILCRIEKKSTDCAKTLYYVLSLISVSSNSFTMARKYVSRATCSPMVAPEQTMGLAVS